MNCVECEKDCLKCDSLACLKCINPLVPFEKECKSCHETCFNCTGILDT